MFEWYCTLLRDTFIGIAFGPEGLKRLKSESFSDITGMPETSVEAIFMIITAGLILKISLYQPSSAKTGIPPEYKWLFVRIWPMHDAFQLLFLLALALLPLGISFLVAMGAGTVIRLIRIVWNDSKRGRPGKESD